MRKALEYNDVPGKVKTAIVNIYGIHHITSTAGPSWSEYCDEVMGKGFWAKDWNWLDDDNIKCVSSDEYARLELFAGEHGKTLYHAWKARHVQGQPGHPSNETGQEDTQSP